MLYPEIDEWLAARERKPKPPRIAKRKRERDYELFDPNQDVAQVIHTVGADGFVEHLELTRERWNELAATRQYRMWTHSPGSCVTVREIRDAMVKVEI